MMDKQHFRLSSYSFPLWGKAGMGAIRPPIYDRSRMQALPAPIPTFPQRGKE